MTDEVNDVRVNTSQQSLRVEDLQQDSSYVFKIKAYTSLGAGIWSHSVSANTRSGGERMSMYLITSSCVKAMFYFTAVSTYTRMGGCLLTSSGGADERQGRARVVEQRGGALAPAAL